MNSDVKVSIIVPVYNVENYIEKCLQSIVEQTYKNIECIIIDDCSPDNSKAIIDMFIEKYPHIFKYVKNIINRGLALSREIGVKQSTGDYIVFLDSDDYLLPTFAEETLTCALHNNADIVTTNHYIDKNGSLKLINRFDKDKVNKFAYNYLWGRIYKKQLLIDFGLYLRMFCEDIPANIRLISNARKMIFIDKPLYGYVHRESSLTNTDKSFDEMKHVLNVIYQEFILWNKFDDEACSFLLSFAVGAARGLNKRENQPKEGIMLYRWFLDLVGPLPKLDDLKIHIPCSASGWNKVRLTVYSRGLYLLNPSVKLYKNKLKSLVNKMF